VGRDSVLFLARPESEPTPPHGWPPQRGSRDTLRNGGMQNWDMSLFKNIPLGKNEARYLQLRLEAFNAFNHPNFDNKNFGVVVDGPWQYRPADIPLTVDKSPDWGKNATTYSGPGGFRVVQLGAKIYL
jgi:hypothetical protein